MRTVWAGATLVAALVSASPAVAGAFTLEPGEIKLFSAGLLSSGDKYFDRKGKLRSRGDYSKYDFQVYAEYGALDGITLFGSTGLQKIKTEAGKTHTREGIGRTEFGARVRLHQSGGLIVSAQASGVIAGAPSSDALAVVGEGDDQADARGLVAYSFEMFGRPAFVDLGAGYRYRSGRPADEARIDATFGIRPIETLLLMVQNFNTIGTGPWRGPFALKQRIHKLQGAAHYNITETISIIASAFFTLDARDALDERGGSLGLGFRF